MRMRKQRKKRKKRRCSPRFMGSFARSSCVKIIWRQAEKGQAGRGEGNWERQPSCLRQPQRRVYLKIMLHYLWPRRLRRQQKESVCIRRTKKLLLHVGGAVQGAVQGEEGWLVGFSIFVSVHFHIFTVCGMRQPHEAKTINCNKLRPTPCKERARPEQGEG